MKLNRMIRIGLAMAVLLSLFAAPAMAKVVSPGDDFYYLDAANVLSEALEGEIFFSNQLLNEACGAQICVVTVESAGGEDIGNYAYDLFNNWQIGDSDKANGFLLLLAIGDDDYYALCGAGLDSKFTSGAIKNYYDLYLEKDFAAGDYESGVKKFFEAVFQRVSDTYNAGVTTRMGVLAYERYIQSEGAAEQGFGGVPAKPKKGSGNMKFLIFVLIVVLVIAMRNKKTQRQSGTYSNPTVTGYVPPRRSVGGGIWPWLIANQVFRSMRRSSRTFHDNVGTGFGGMHGSARRPSSSGFSSGFRSSGSGFRSSSGFHSGGFGGARGGGGFTRGGGAGRGRH